MAAGVREVVMVADTKADQATHAGVGMAWDVAVVGLEMMEDA